MFLLASTDRDIRFIMFKGIYELPWIKPFARILKAFRFRPSCARVR